ncbi:MAG TPA: rhodanese-like domain-containing protein [Planctomycetaceae bacterium]|jgi:rhodanese-related sulfurtransferase
MSQSPRFQKLVAAVKEHVAEVSAAEALERQRNGALLIDVREADEFQKSHAPDAIHLARGILERDIEQAVPDLETPLICYCGGGSRSALAVENLQRMGYVNAVSMAGGLKDWKNQNLPTT